jgi:hypothetical protein
MRFKTAVFGDIGGRHGIVGCAPTGRSLFQDIANRTDRPGYSPPGITWPPYLSGFLFKDYYFLMRTFPDESASRAGMVRTFAITAEATEACAISNLAAVVAALPKHITADWIPSGDLDISDQELTREMPSHIPSQLARTLVTSSAVVVWGDPDSFDFIVISIWDALWPSLRRNFSFRLSFDPADIDIEKPPTLVTSPRQVSARWQKHNFIVPGADTFSQSNTQKTLFGEEFSGLQGLRDDLQANISEFRQLNLLGLLYRSRQQEKQTFSSLRSQLQLAGKLAPAPEQGTTLKALMLQEVAREIPQQSTATELRGLRNIPWQSFEKARARMIFTSLTHWVETNAALTTLAGDSVSALLYDAITEESEWGLAILSGLASCLRQNANSTIEAIWVWIQGELMPYSEKLLTLYITDSHRQSTLADATPDLTTNPELPKRLAEISRERQWFDLHAAVLSHTSDSHQSVIAAHLKALPQNDMTGIERLRTSFGSREFFNLSTKLKDVRLIDAAVKCLVDAPELWAKYDAQEVFFRRLFIHWLQTFGLTGLESEMGRSVVAKSIEAAIDTADDALLSRIVSTQPDWSNWPLQPDIWSKIPSLHRDAVLQSTANAWLAKFLDGKASLPESRELRPYFVQETTVRPALERTSSPMACVELFERFPELSEPLLISWLHSISRSANHIPFTVARRIGDLILSRRWSAAADELSRLAENRTDLRPALDVSHSLLGTMRRIQLLVIGLLGRKDEIDLWSALEELGLRLYPYGPGVDDLWQRAGGEVSDLSRFITGREAWSTVISQARVGRYQVTLGSLAKAMLKDYPHNEDLKMIARLINER